MKDTMCGLVKEVNAPSGLVYHTDLPIPEINDDEVLIKVHCSAICGTDLHGMGRVVPEADQGPRYRGP